MADEGRRGAHTQLPGDLAAALGEFEEASAGENADLLSLLADSVELNATDSLSLAAKSVTEARKGAGRPLGAKNRRNADVFDYLEAHGHRAPEYTLSLIQTIDPRQLAVMMRRHKHFDAALGKIIKAAEALLPYKLAKRSPDVVLPPPQERPSMFIGQFNVNLDRAPDGALSAGHIIDDDAEMKEISGS